MGLWSDVFQILILVPSLSLADILSISHLINVNGFLKLKIYAVQFHVSWCFSPHRDCALACNAITDSCGAGTDWRDGRDLLRQSEDRTDTRPLSTSLLLVCIVANENARFDPHHRGFTTLWQDTNVHYCLLSTEEDWTFDSLCGLIMWNLTFNITRVRGRSHRISFYIALHCFFIVFM